MVEDVINAHNKKNTLNGVNAFFFIHTRNELSFRF